MSSSRVFVVMTAAGQSRRMGGTDKLTLPVLGRPLLAHTALAFLEWPRLEAMAVSVSPGREQELEMTFARHCPNPQKVTVLTGGQERQDSVRLGLELLHSIHAPTPTDFVMIHDGARPFIDTVLLEALLDSLATCDGVLPATPVRDTIKRVDGFSVVRTEDRETLRMVQTPQAFRFCAILELHRRAHREDFFGTDDASLMEHYGGKVNWISGPAHNLKVTVPEDIALLTELARSAVVSRGVH